jgi:signal transduction histidine kinase
LPPGEQRTVTVNVSAEGPVYAMADPAKLERAIENLVDNARKFTPAGGTIAVRAQPATEGRVTIEVANDCEEISDDEVPKLFERFYRRDRTRSARTPGSGLGLAIARDLVRLQNGELEAEAKGNELLFRVTLKATVSDVTA